MQKDRYVQNTLTYELQRTPLALSINTDKRGITLPAGLTSHVGRENDLLSLHDLLSQQRLINLVGPGGIGKTRLALAVAMQNQARFKQGAFFVSLIPVLKTELLAESIAISLGFTFYSHEKPMDQLIKYLRDKNMLIVLDNFEHLLPATPTLITILERAPGISLLVTSRERLNCYGEWVFEVKPLTYPLAETELVAQVHSAVKLFCERAESVCPGFKLNTDNSSQIVRICQLVGGLPLALELAATWTKTLSCAEIVTELTQTLDFLTTTLSGIPERHRTLRKVFYHSWLQLTEIEQQAFRALSVFAGSFTRVSAKAVASASLPLLSSLIDKSFLSYQGENRYTIHPVLKEYGHELLVQADEYEIYRDRHAEYYLTLLSGLTEALSTANSHQAEEQIEEDIDNVRLAWEWAAAHSQTARLAGGEKALFSFYERKNRLYEGVTLFTETIEQLQSFGEPIVRDKIMCQLQIHLGALCNHLTENKLTTYWLQQGLVLAEKLQALAEIAFALSELARQLANQGKFSEAAKLNERSLTLSRQLGNEIFTAANLLNLGNISRWYGEYGQAKIHYQTALGLLNTNHAPILKAKCLRQLAQVDDSFQQAVDYAEQALSICREANLWVMEGLVLNTLGELFMGQGDYVNGQIYFQNSLSIAYDVDNRLNEGAALLNLSSQCRYLHDYTSSQIYLDQALALIEPNQHWLGMLMALLQMGSLLALQGDFASAQTHLEQVLQKSREINRPQLEAETLYLIGFIAYQKQNYEQAQACCHQAFKIAQVCKHRTIQIVSLTCLGHTLLDAARWVDAAAAYKQALMLIPHWPTCLHFSFAPRVGMTYAILMQGDQLQAQASMKHLLEDLNDEALPRDYVPLVVYWYCYHVLAVQQDVRANEILHRAYEILQERAARTANPELRLSYLQEVRENQAIQHAFTQSATRDLPITAPITLPIVNPLTRREEQILRLVDRGLSNQEIADQLVISIYTVKRHLTNIYQKMDVTSRQQAARYARLHGLL